MKRCVKCQIDLPDSHSFCKFCAGPLSLVSASRLDVGSRACPACGAEVKSAWRFCKHCAHDLQGGPFHLGPQACKRCGAPVAAGLKCCQGCETPVDIAQTQAVTPVVASFGSAAAAAQAPVIEPDEHTLVVARSPALQCRECDAPITQGLNKCSVCGAAIGGVPSPLQVSRRLQLGLIAAAAVGFLAVGGVVAYYFWYSNSALQKKLDAAITRADLFKPEGASAYDFYHQLKKDGVDESVLGRYVERLVPQLTAQPIKMLADFAVPTNREPDLSEWQDALKRMAWAAELKPDDGTIMAKAKYIEGRIAYLSNKKDDALTLWKRASELDKTWALATNAVGVLYNERKQYQTARQFALEAIRREPNWAVPYNNVGTSYFLEKADDKAEPYYQQAVEHAPTWPRPHAWLGDIASRRKDYSRAVTEYEKVLNLAQLGATTIDLDEIKKRLEVARQKAGNEVVLEDGLRYVDIVEGSGPTPQTGKIVHIHYIGTLTNGTRFDSSFDQGRPIEFRIGTGSVIKGWDKGLMSMRVGGKRKLIVPPNLGYGVSGRPPSIPGNATLIFEVELLAVELYSGSSQR